MWGRIRRMWGGQEEPRQQRYLQIEVTEDTEGRKDAQVVALLPTENVIEAELSLAGEERLRQEGVQTLHVPVTMAPLYYNEPFPTEGTRQQIREWMNEFQVRYAEQL